MTLAVERDVKPQLWPTKDEDAGNMEECLYLDICQGENRAILNGVTVNLKLFQSLNDFRLMRLGAKITN